MSNTSITPVQIAWVAGIYEGEGTLILTPGGQWQLSIKMADEDIIRRLHLHTGIGHVNALGAEQAHWKPQWRWTVTRKQDLAGLLWMIRPYLGQRRGQRADEFLNWIVAGCPSLATEEHREKDRMRMQRARGWSEPKSRTTI